MKAISFGPGEGAVVITPVANIPERGNPVGLKGLLVLPLGVNPEFSEELNGFIETPAVKTYTVMLSTSFAMQFVGIGTVLGAGSLEGSVMVGDISVVDFSAGTNPIVSNCDFKVLAGALIRLDVTVVTDASDFGFTLFFKRL